MPMAELKTEQEPSIEEILESIRQIISEDTDNSPKPGAGVDLSAPQEVQDKSSLVLKGAPGSPSDKAVPLDLASKAGPADKAVPLDLSPPSIEIEMMDSPMTDKTNILMSPQTAEAVTDELSKILAANVAVEAESTGRPGKVTLEEIARDLMRPLIKTWIDQNLPGIIEKAVQKEVEKLSRRVMDRQ